MRLVGILFLIVCLFHPARADQHDVKARLDAELSAVDRIEIFSTAETVNEKGAPVEKKPICIIEGSGVAREFCNVWAIDDRSSDWQCMCNGDVYLDFFNGPKKLQRLRYFHGIAFRMEDGALIGSAWIQKKDRERVLDWLNRHGTYSMKLRVDPEPNQSAHPPPAQGQRG